MRYKFLMHKKSHNRLKEEKRSFLTCYNNSSLDRCGLVPTIVVQCDYTISAYTSMTIKGK